VRDPRLPNLILNTYNLELKKDISDRISAIRKRASIRARGIFYDEIGLGGRRERLTQRSQRTQSSQRREVVALMSKSPPFAKGAKDGAPSSTLMGGVTIERERRRGRNSRRGDCADMGRPDPVGAPLRGKPKSTVPSRLRASKSDCTTRAAKGQRGALRFGGEVGWRWGLAEGKG